MVPGFEDLDSQKFANWNYENWLYHWSLQPRSAPMGATPGGDQEARGSSVRVARRENNDANDITNDSNTNNDNTNNQTNDTDHDNDSDNENNNHGCNNKVDNTI